MFLIKRRWLATAGLMAALFLAAPAPSLAAGRWKPGAELSAGLVARAWSWLESLGIVRRAPERQPAAVWEKQGVMIDPNGLFSANTEQATWRPESPRQGSAADDSH